MVVHFGELLTFDTHASPPDHLQFVFCKLKSILDLFSLGISFAISIVFDVSLFTIICSSSYLLFYFFSSIDLMASSDPLVLCRIIGDVVDVFVPRMTMNVYYGPKHVTNGCNIKPSIATNPPRVAFTDHSNDQLYTLVCGTKLSYLILCSLYITNFTFDNFVVQLHLFYALDQKKINLSMLLVLSIYACWFLTSLLLAHR